MTNKRDGILYAGVTSTLPKRAYEHREGEARGFTKEHGLKRIVYYEWHDTIQSAIQREKNIKHWPRAWKIRLIHSMNPNWDDLYNTLAQDHRHALLLCLRVWAVSKPVKASRG